MKTVSGQITHRIHEVLIVWEGRGVVKELEKDGEDGSRMRLGADAGVIVTYRGEGHLWNIFRN